jgi:DNA polymerase III subunit epsilon
MGMGEKEYRREVVDEVVALLRGEGGEDHLRALVAERQRLAAELEFEAAARLRDLIAGIERVRLSRAVVSAEGVQAVVAPSTEPGVVEVFILREGRLISHRGFEPKDTRGLIGFAGEALARPAPNGSESGKQKSNEARIVAAYLRRRSTVVEAVQLREARDLLKVAESVAEAAGEDAASLAEEPA